MSSMKEAKRSEGSASPLNEDLEAEANSFLAVPVAKIVSMLCTRFLSGSTAGKEGGTSGESKLSPSSPTAPNRISDTTFRQFCDSLVVTVGAFYTRRTGFVKEYWESRYPIHQELPPLHPRYDVLDQQLREKYTLDLQLLDTLRMLLDAAQYRTLTPKLFQVAAASSFEVNFPTEVQWSTLDSAMLPLWYTVSHLYPPTAANVSDTRPSSTTEERAEGRKNEKTSKGKQVGEKAVSSTGQALVQQLAQLIERALMTTEQKNERGEFYKHLLVYTRGVSQKTVSGLYLMEKIDILLEWIWIWCLNKLLSWLSNVANSDSRGQKENSNRKREPVGKGPPPVSPTTTFGAGLLGTTIDATTSTATPSSATSFTQLKRTTLKGYLKKNGFWNSFLKPVTLQEPHFDSVILIHKRLPSPGTASSPTTAPSSSNSASGSSSASESKVPHHGPSQQQELSEDGSPILFNEGTANDVMEDDKMRTALRIREFRNIPFADLEALFPAVKVGLPPLDSVKFAIQIVTLLSFLWMSIRSLETDSADVDTSTILLLGVLLLGLISRLVGVVYYYIGIITWYQRDLEDWLLSKRVGQGPTVVSKLCDDVCFQETKELILSYFFLWQFGPLTVEELDRQVENTVAAEWGRHIDFDAFDAVEKLVALGLACAIGSDDGTCTPNAAGTASGDAQRYSIIMSPEDWVNAHPVQHLNVMNVRK